MNKAELIEGVAAGLREKGRDVSAALVTDVLDGLMEQVRSRLAGGGSVELRGFGRFETADRAARRVRNPQTGEMMQVPAKRVPKFRPGKELEQAVAR